MEDDILIITMSWCVMPQPSSYPSLSHGDDKVSCVTFWPIRSITSPLLVKSTKLTCLEIFWRFTFVTILCSKWNVLFIVLFEYILVLAFGFCGIGIFWLKILDLTAFSISWTVKIVFLSLQTSIYIKRYSVTQSVCLSVTFCLSPLPQSSEEGRDVKIDTDHPWCI